MSMDPSMMSMMKDLDGAEMNAQLETLGLSPSEVINKIMAEPDLAAAFQKPKVMQVRRDSFTRERSVCALMDTSELVCLCGAAPRPDSAENSVPVSDSAP